MLGQAAAHSAAQPLRIATEPRRRALLGSSGARLASSFLLGGVVLLILLAIAGMVLGLWRFTVISTGSMRSTLNPGDVAVLTPERSTAVRRGQIVAFHPPGEAQLTVVHRVFSVHRVQGELVIQTKGDANNAIDQWHARILGNTVWRESTKLPEVGYLSVWSRQKPIRLGLLIAIVTLVVSILMGTIWRATPG
jgi:signal peptidase